MGPQEGLALACALPGIGQPQLPPKLSPYEPKFGSQALQLGDGVMAEVIKGLKEYPKLRRLILWGTGMAERASEALMEGLRVDTWPFLQELDASDNPLGLCGDGLAEVFGDGGGGGGEAEGTGCLGYGAWP